MKDLDRHYVQFQLQLLHLDLQLAEAEENPKRSGDFESTYKTKSGKEVSVNRSPDGKFASNSSIPGATTSVVETAPTLDPKVARENGQAVREVLTGKVGDDLKKDLAADFKHRPDIQQAIEKVDFAKMLKGDKDALSNLSDFAKVAFEQAVSAASQGAREVLTVAISVAEFTASVILRQMAFGGVLILGSAGILTFKKGMRPDNAIAQQAVGIAPGMIKEIFSSLNVTQIASIGLIFDGVGEAIKLAANAARKKEPPLIEPSADEQVAQALRSIGGDRIKSGLIANAANHPSIAEGIENTKIEDVIKGDKDTIGNAIDFMHSQIDKAANAISEHQEELAIGAAVVGVGVVGAVLGLAIAATATAVIGDSVAGVIAGRTLSGAAQFALKRLSADRVKDLIKAFKLPTIITIGVSVVNTIGNVKKRVQEVRAEDPRPLGERSFGENEEAVKKIVADEGMDYADVLESIARRNEQPPNLKKAEQVQKEILELQGEIQEGVSKVQRLVTGKLALTASDIIQITRIAKKEVEIRNKLIEKKGELGQAEGRGFSLTKRLNELTDIAQKEGRESSNYKWRANVVKAEVKYGEKLDNLGGFGGYDQLLNSMKMPNLAPGKYELPTYEDDRKITTLFNQGGARAQTSTSDQRKVVADALEVGQDLQQFLATPINAKVGLAGSITCAFPGGNNKYSQMTKDAAEIDPGMKLFTETELFNDKNVDGYINIGDVVLANAGLKLQGYNSLASTKEHTREMMWHESGHLLEVKLGKVAESVAFREERAAEIPNDKKEIPPQGLSLGSQDYALGEFYSPYIGLRMKGLGKHANTERATEVLSSGMELLSSPTMAERGAKADRETMLYALSAMNEKVKD